MQNQLKNQTSPYLLQHAENPVNWYPWCKEAFEQAKWQDKPIFLSIGYSTCHWCHVMAHESFEDSEIAQILNESFISIKVDKEERPDIDSIYMAVCQAFTGSGGWPTTIFLTPEQKPFFAGTYFPKNAKYGQIGLRELLLTVKEKWRTDRAALLTSADEVTLALSRREDITIPKCDGNMEAGDNSSKLIEQAVKLYKQIFDTRFGGFGRAPKFPTPHNLIFLLRYYEKSEDAESLKMVEKTLLQMYCGGIFDHIGGGFCRYSTDDYYLVPHFEKMLYDNALLILAYSKAYQITKKKIYRIVAEKTAAYVLWELTGPEGGFYSAQDADSEGVEGKFYLFKPSEILKVLGKEAGEAFNQHFDITEKGNFEGKNIPNLLQSMEKIEENFDAYMPALYEYRKKRYVLHLDDKILTAWNGLMIAAMCTLYRITANQMYLNAAVKAQKFIEDKLWEKETLHVSFRAGRLSGRGFLDDYAFEVYALLALYEATIEKDYLERATEVCKNAIVEFWDEEYGGFFLYGKNNEQLILQPKETYDGAIFRGNSAMAYNLVRLHLYTGEEYFAKLAKRQLGFLSVEAKSYPVGHAMFLIALQDYLEQPEKITIVVKEPEDIKAVSCQIPLDAIVIVLNTPTKEYPLLNDRTTYYVCRGYTCKPPVNELAER